MSLRELLLIGIVAVVCVLALIRPKYGLYGYMWYALMRPDVLAFVEDDRNIYSFVIFCVTAISALRHIGNISRLFQSFFFVTLLLLQILLGLSVLNAVYYDLAVPRYIFFVKMFGALLLIPLLVETEKDLRELLLVIGLSLGAVGIKHGLWGVMHGGVQLVRGYGPMFADNNFLALGLATVMPICWYARALTANQTLRWILLSMFIFCIPAIVMTNSRGGTLTMGVVLLYVLLRTRNKAVALLLILGVTGGAIYLVQDMFVSRMSTLQDVEEEASAASRLFHLKIAFRMWLDYPMLGVGFGGVNYAALADRYGESATANQHVAHNSYAQMLVDSGVFALLLYVAALLGSIWWLNASRKRMLKWFARDPAREAIPAGLQGAMIAFVVDSTFYSCQRMDLPYMFLFVIGVWQIIERQLLAQVQSGAFQHAGLPTGAMRPLPVTVQGPPNLRPSYRNWGSLR